MFLQCGTHGRKIGVAYGTPKIFGLLTFSCNLEISTAFGKSLEVSFSAFISVSEFCMFFLGLAFSNKGLGVSGSLGFYQSSPLRIFPGEFFPTGVD